MKAKNTLLPIHSSLQSRGRLLDISEPVIMGILNATPDSFYNKGKDSDMNSILKTAEKMLEDGAMILDIGGTSTKPGSPISSAEDEARRVMPIVEALAKQFPAAWLSIDTYHAHVAKWAVEAGVSIVNDVSSGRLDGEMLQTVAALKVPYIAMHMQGTPETMQQDPQYGEVVSEVREYLRHICDSCSMAGITDIIIDPGFGFGKTTEHNYALLNNLHTFRMLGRPVLAGLSRKSIVCKPLRISPEKALNATTALHVVALQQGANILRVHDVKEAMEVIKLFKHLE
jgi:dihydropteroate synthase